MVTQQIFLERLVRGEIIPFLGSEIHLLSNPIINSPDQVALELAEVLKFPNFAGTLPMICQYYQMEHDRSSLLRDTQRFIGNECTDMQENPIFHLLGAIRSPLLILSSLYDNGLEKVFEKKNKHFVVISHHTETIPDTSITV